MSTFDVTLADIEAARRRIAGHVRVTPTYASEALARRLGAASFVKLECVQLAGSFKPRGNFNKLLSLSEAERRRGVVTVSGGNHAIAVAQVGGALGIDVLVLMPKSASPFNVGLTRAAGARVELCESAAEAFARAEAVGREGRINVHAYDDPLIIAGHGTVGLEIAEQVTDATHVFASIGGGGFTAGLAAALKARRPSIRIVGVETEGAETMTASLAAGKPTSIAPTSIARTLGAPFTTARTLAAAQAFLEEIVVVPDAEAVRELLWLWANEHVLVEPAAACVVAAALRRAASFKPGDRVVLVLCGSNVAIDDIAAWRRQFAID